MTKISDDAFASIGLSSSYAFLLMIVNDHPGVQPTEISQQMQLTPSTVTRLIEKMEHRKYLERKTNGRTTEVYPTVDGEKLQPKIKKAWANLYHSYSTVLGKDFSKRLTEDINLATQKL
ncbi:MAG: MarR family transcriptional regulator [Bacteroidota bacterium]